jgi:hypothetical protein
MSLEKERESHIEKGTTDLEEIDFGGDTSLPPPPALTEEEEKKLWRKVDLRLMPILALMYLLSFMDRGELHLLRLSLRYLHAFKKETSVMRDCRAFRPSSTSLIISSMLRW